MGLPIIKETHLQGSVQIENRHIIDTFDVTDCDFGIQVHNDGRVWICINGIAFLRFKAASSSSDHPVVTTDVQE